MTNVPTPFGSTVFCDDIREETGGKLTLVGTYTRGMVVNSDFPVHVPKFCLYVRYYERPNESDGPVHISIFLPGDDEDRPSISERLDIEEVRERLANLAPPSDLDDPLMPMDFFAVLTPLALVKEGQIKVRAYRDGKEVRLGALRVTRAVTSKKDESGEPAG